MDKPGISAAARRLIEEDARYGRFAVREVIHRPGRPTGAARRRRRCSASRAPPMRSRPASSTEAAARSDRRQHGRGALGRPDPAEGRRRRRARPGHDDDAERPGAPARADLAGSRGPGGGRTPPVHAGAVSAGPRHPFLAEAQDAAALAPAPWDESRPQDRDRAPLLQRRRHPLQGGHGRCAS
jgi:hypothetical protein